MVSPVRKVSSGCKCLRSEHEQRSSPETATGGEGPRGGSSKKIARLRIDYQFIYWTARVYHVCAFIRHLLKKKKKKVGNDASPSKINELRKRSDEQLAPSLLCWLSRSSKS